MDELMNDYYSILRVKPDSSMDEIKAAYRKLVFQLHPDKNKDPLAVEKFKKVTKAFSVLSNSKSRLEYDISLENQYKIQLFKQNMSDIILKLDNQLKIKINQVNKKIIKDYEIDDITLNLPFSELMQRLFYSEDIDVKKSAAEALVEKDKRIAYSILFRFLKKTDNPEIIIFILKILEKNYKQKIFEDLNLISFPNISEIKFAILEIFENNYNENVRELAIKLLEDDDPQIRLRTIKLLYKKDKPLILQRIYNLLSDPDKKVLVEVKNIYNLLKKEIKRQQE
ncbi:MAG: DnaJ domain-containing protein [Exilispira sp.]|jgi:curved DNA-binding protein CbpA|nr:DnaJ domain-containing protein [Exilispira sp.]